MAQSAADLGTEPIAFEAFVVRPAEAPRAMTRAMPGAVVIESDRGEAQALAPRLLAELGP